MALSSIHGFPRIGPRRELKFATEAYWSGERSADELQAVARELRRANWELMRDAGIDLIPSNDFSFYDQMLDTTALVGAVPERYGHGGGDLGLDTYFAMARGTQEATAMEMTKWFDTNYHYIVPELGPDTRFALSSGKPFAHFSEARELGIVTKPVLVGPLTWLLLAKAPEGFDRLSLLEPLLEVYAEVLARLGGLGAEWVQIDEPAFVEDRSPAELAALGRALERLAEVEGRPKIVASTYFDHAGEALPVLAGSPIEGIGLDLVRGRRNVDLLREHGDLGQTVVFAGVVDGRNVWVNDLDESLELLGELPGEVIVSTSCSLQHVPIDLDAEPAIDDELRSWMTFAKQKVHELAVITRGFDEGPEAISAELERNRAALADRRQSPRTRNPGVRKRVAALTEADARRSSPFAERHKEQKQRLDLPRFATTTIGSFPQTSDIREARIRFRRGDISREQYLERMRAEIARVIELQETIGLDVLVHGEPERNDMVQYFAEEMEGFVSTENAWVQSYGTRYVRPPVLYGDVSRPHPITVEWITYAQSLTQKPVKGMLTGPVTMLMWSFVRDDQPLSETCRQAALAIRDDVADLEAAGIGVIQVDEPAIREGLPLRHEGWADYLDWAVLCYRLATAGVRDETQVHTHMCYSEFRDIMHAVSDLDADVLLIWHARSQKELLEYWRERGYNKDIAPGVYDIHSPRVPPAGEMADMLRELAEAIPPEQLWVAPDCGLKTRGYQETEASLRNMVDAARQLREELAPARA
jgi:5-methyltetrahydropteroyltriglutamate--homocysteine methyltransferase